MSSKLSDLPPLALPLQATDLVYAVRGATSGQVEMGDLLAAATEPAPGWRTPPAQVDLYAQFTQPTQNYYAGGTQTSSFTTWLAAVSGTFTRAGAVAPYWNSSGLLANGSADTPRFSYDPVTLAPCMLYEPASANMVTFSQQPNNTVWNFTSTGVTRTNAAATGLDGTTSAGTIRETTSSTQHYVWWRDGGAGLTSGLFYAYQIFIKPINRTKMRIKGDTSGIGSVAFIVDFVNITVTDPTWSIKLLSNGFFWLYKTFTATATAIPSIQFFLLNASGADTYAGSATAGWDLGGAQLEQVAGASSPPSTYIQRPTATAVSRSADALSFTLPASASNITYTFANGVQQIVSVSAGFYSVPTTLSNYQIASFIDVDLTKVAVPVLSVAGRAGNVTLWQADISGLRTNDIARFSSVAVSGSAQTFGPAIFQNDSAMFRWTANSNSVLSAANRYVLIGFNAGNSLAAASNSNAVVIGTSAATSSTSVATSTVIGDTAGGTCPTINNSELIGNEAGSGPTVASSSIIGNLARVGGAGATCSGSIIMGQAAMFANGAVDTVAIGFSVGKGTTGSVGSINRSVLIGSQAGMSVGAAATTMTNLFLIGYNVQPPTATTSNYLNFGNFLKGDLTTGEFSLTKQDGSAARLAMNGVIITGSKTPSSATDTGTAGEVCFDNDYIYRCIATNTWVRAPMTTW